MKRPGRVLAAAKHQVLKQVGESGLAGLFVFRADVVPDVDGDDGGLVVLMHDYGEPVVEHEALVWDIDFFVFVFFLFLRRLRSLGRRLGGTAGHECKREEHSHKFQSHFSLHIFAANFFFC